MSADSICALMQCTLEPIVCNVMHGCCFCDPQDYWLAELTVPLEQNDPARGQQLLFDDALDQLLRMHRTLCLPQARSFIPLRTGYCLRTIAIHSGPMDTFHALLHSPHCLVLDMTYIHSLFCCCLSAECRGDTCVLGQARPLRILNMPNS